MREKKERNFEIISSRTSTELSYSFLIKNNIM